MSGFRSCLNLAGRYMVAYILLCVVALLVFGGPKRQEPIMMVLGIPLIYLALILELELGIRDEWLPFVYFSLFLVNIGFWGFALAGVHRLVQRQRSSGVNPSDRGPANE